MRFVFVGCHAAVTDLEHIRIVPMTGRRERCMVVLAKSDPRHRVPSISDIARRPPKVAANVGSPFPDVQTPVLAKAVNDRTARFEECITHLLLDSGHFFVSIVTAGTVLVV